MTLLSAGEALPGATTLAGSVFTLSIAPPSIVSQDNPDSLTWMDAKMYVPLYVLYSLYIRIYIYIEL